MFIFFFRTFTIFWTKIQIHSSTKGTSGQLLAITFSDCLMPKREWNSSECSTVQILYNNFYFNTMVIKALLLIGSCI